MARELSLRPPLARTMAARFLSQNAAPGSFEASIRTSAAFWGSFRKTKWKKPSSWRSLQSCGMTATPRSRTAMPSSGRPAPSGGCSQRNVAPYL